MCEGCEGCEGCAKGFDAGQGLLRVGAWWHARLLTAQIVCSMLESFSYLSGLMLGKCAHNNEHMCSGKFPAVKRVKSRLRPGLGAHKITCSYAMVSQ